MENIGIVLICAACVVMLAVIFVYNHFDRMRFRMERQIQYNRGDLDRWAELCGQRSPGADEAYRKAKKPAARMECLAGMVRAASPASEEMLDLQEALSGFCSAYNQTAEQYDRHLQWPVIGKIAGRLGFRPFERLDFYRND